MAERTNPAQIEPQIAPHHFDRCVCGHLRQAHRPTSCLGSSLKRGGTGKSWSAPVSSICNCQGFESDGTRFIIDADPKTAAAVKAGRKDGTFLPIAEAEEIGEWVVLTEEPDEPVT